ncbi:MAG TPA: PilZ domain-containing protein, partial [Candidatus Methylomirabilis sp.]
RRYPVRYSVTVDPEGSRQSLDGALLDVSGRGLLLFLHQTLPVGERVGVKLEAPGAAFSLPGRIVWAATRQGLSHVHGVELESEQDRQFAEHIFKMAHELW